jgi:hypothetical protein
MPLPGTTCLNVKHVTVLAPVYHFKTNRCTSMVYSVCVAEVALYQKQITSEGRM